MGDSDYDDLAFRMFAQAYPHEAYSADPERFWVWFSADHPGISRDEMRAMLGQSESGVDTGDD